MTRSSITNPLWLRRCLQLLNDTALFNNGWGREPEGTKPVEPPKVEQPVFRVTYRKRERNGGGYYDIMDSRGKKVNEKNLTEEEADNMLKSLQA